MSARMILLTVAMIGLILAIGVGCGASAPEPGRYYNDQLEFSIKFPAGWDILIEDEGGTISAISPLVDDDDLFYESISVTSEELPLRLDADEILEQVLELYKQEGLRITEHDRGSAIVDGEVAEWIACSYTMVEGTVRARLYCLMSGNRAYVISFDAEPHTYIDYQAEQIAAAESFKTT